jgi:transcriptional antiterminator
MSVNDYITTREAAELLKVTDRTIRRKLSALSPQMSAKYIKKQGGKILILKSFVLDGLQTEKPPKTEKKKTQSPGIVEHLTEQLKIKDTQINKLTELLKESSEREKETHYLLGQANKEKEKLMLLINAPKEVETTPPPTEPKQNPSKELTTKDGVYFVLICITIIVLIFVLLSRILD